MKRPYIGALLLEVILFILIQNIHKYKTRITVIHQRISFGDGYFNLVYRRRVIPCQLTRWCNGDYLRFFSYSHFLYIFTIVGYLQIVRLQIAIALEKSAIKVRGGSGHLVELAFGTMFEELDFQSRHVNFLVITNVRWPWICAFWIGSNTLSWLFDNRLHIQVYIQHVNHYFVKVGLKLKKIS